MLQAAAELFVGRNYGIALIFVTPLALLMGQLGHEVAVGPLLFDRAAETAVAASSRCSCSTPRGFARVRAGGRAASDADDGR
ncbi:FUSC family protein [Dermacoccus sp. Tok2021]|uniref:FUSC family protein n=1 Tax=Dermacoccus sp. Tok2021 TaxID=2826873 RepID=UPI00351D3113